MQRFALLTLFATAILLNSYHCQSGIGIHAPGEQLVHVKYLEAQTSGPSERANLSLAFFYDGGAELKNLTFVTFFEKSDTNNFEIILYDGGAGNGPNFINYTLKANNAIYYRVQSNFYGFYNN